MTRDDEGEAMKGERRETRAVAPRRNFLKLAGLGAAAAGAAALTGRGAEAAQAATADESRATAKGYRETAHVRRVYELSRF